MKTRLTNQENEMLLTMSIPEGLAYIWQSLQTRGMVEGSFRRWTLTPKGQKQREVILARRARAK